MAPKLYMLNASPPVRAVLITARQMNLNLQEQIVNTLEGDQMKPEYLKINPQHTIPTLDDNGFILWDSHAIIVYLVEKYAKDDSLYPKDIQKRAVIDQRLHFDTGVLFSRFIQIARMVRREGKKPTEKDLELFTEAYDFLEAFLEKGEYIAGSSLSVADFSIIASVSSIEVFVPIIVSKWPKLRAWFKKIEALPAYEANKDGLKLMKTLFGAQK